MCRGGGGGELLCVTLSLDTAPYMQITVQRVTVCLCFLVLPPPPRPPAAGPATKRPCAPRPTTVFYHHLLRKEAQEGGDK